MKRLFLTLICLALILTACNLPASRPVQATPAIDSQGLVGTIAAMTLEAMITPTFTPLPTKPPTPTGTPTLTPTVTPTYETPILLLNGNVNCRKGPGEVYDVLAVLSPGQKVEAVGRLDKTNYWLVKRPDNAETCWITDDFARVTGSVQALPTVTAPPAPTPKPPNPPGWASYKFTCEFASGGSTMTMNLEWTDRANNETGYIVYRDGQAIITLGPDTTSYTDVTFVAAGQSVSYKVEVINKSGAASTSTINYTCQ